MQGQHLPKVGISSEANCTYLDCTWLTPKPQKSTGVYTLRCASGKTAIQSAKPLAPGHFATALNTSANANASPNLHKYLSEFLAKAGKRKEDVAVEEETGH